MRIERHQIGAKRLREATEDFAGRIGRSVRLQQEAGRDGFGWQMIANDLLDYAGARSVEDPRIDRDAWTALRSAAEAHLGALELADPAGPPVTVMIPYTRTGVSYEPAPEDDVSPRGVFERDWQEALYLCVLVGDPRRCWMTFERTAGHAFSPFSRALSDMVFGDGERAGDLIGTPGTDAERALHALATGDQDAFWTAIAAMLARPRGEDPRPRTLLLPPAPLALTAIAVRDNGWEQRIESDYLPPSITRGGRSHGAETAQRPRVGPYGADRKPFPLPATVERPPFDDHSEALAYHDAKTPEMVENAWSPPASRKRIPHSLAWDGWKQVVRFQFRAESDPQGRDPRSREALELASEFYAAAFRTATAPGETVEITIGGRTAPMTTSSIEPEDLSNYEWHHAIALALIIGSKERRGLLLGIDPDALASEWCAPAHHAFHVALRAYLRGEPARPATDRALAAVRNAAAAQPGILWPFTVLLSQLVAGDPDGFVAALVDALEEFREHYTAGDEQDSVGKQVPIDILALTCHAHRELGWEIPVVSDYLPTAIVSMAEHEI
ncbi:Imm49 family immunity protein [Actinomadura sp. NPDC048955]|uniref:immunity 49 family protein n=1 Tax=Actinomadura sp. NPDC048955 TaxID=3158228 RepID=UPI003407A608